MENREDYDAFLAALRKETSMDAFTADETGLVSLRVQDDYNLNLQFVEATGRVLCFVEVAELPADAPAAAVTISAVETPTLGALGNWRYGPAAGAVPETLDGAGVLFAPDAPPEAVAETIARVLRGPALREAVLKRQDERLARFHARDAWKELKEVLFG